MNINYTKIKKACLKLSTATERQKNTLLRYLVDELIFSKKDILQANQTDVKNAVKNKLSDALIERLKLDTSGIYKIIQRVKKVEKLQSRVGKILTAKKLDNGLILKKLAVPIGSILVIYEARPEVTIDVAILCIKSGNAVILKGGSEAMITNIVLNKCIQKALVKSGFAKETVSFISKDSKKGIKNLLQKSEVIDLVIARGGYDLVKFVYAYSIIPVLAHAEGGARIYVDNSADQLLAQMVIMNAKTSKPAACNSLDTVVVHRNIADQFVGLITKELNEQNVKVIDEKQATEKDWDTEFLGLTVAIKVVKDVEEAIIFINKHSKKHSEGIIANDKNVIKKFTQAIDAASIFVNCSTRLHDGEVFGLGAEMGISTGKFHVRGPVGLEELSSIKWIVEGNGQVR